MKKYFLLFFTLIFFTNSYSQIYNFKYPDPGNGSLRGGMGLQWIDGELNYTFHFTPEFAFDKFGIGLDLQLNFNRQGKLRTKDFNEFSDYLRVIRYLRYGEKGDPAYIKLGALNYYTLGHGSIMYNYFNSPTYYARRAGLIVDIDFGKFGIESIYSNFGERGIIGARGYFRPFQFTSQESIPIIGGLQIGASYVVDMNKRAGFVSGYFAAGNNFIPTVNEGSIKIIGLDIGLPLLSSNYFDLTLYADYAKIINFGNGISTGFLFRLKNLGLFKINGKIERRFNGDHYIPSYFNSLYEIERFSSNPSNNTFTSKASLLMARNASDNGIFGELGINVAGLFYIRGSYQRLDKTPASGILHLGTEINPQGSSFIIRAGYDRINISSETDIFKLDNNSYLYAEYGYKVAKYLLLSMLYNWTYSPLRNSNGDIIGYKPQKRVEPRISFIYPVNY